MGTTAEKLKYLNEKKAEIKNALETPYNVMRDYPELIKKYIDNQPTKVVTDGICGNAVDVPVKAIEINGNIRQETTEGYNILQNIAHKNDENYTTDGITFTQNNDGSIVANGTATVNTRYSFISEGGTRENIKAGTYRITGCPSGGSTTTYKIVMGITGVGEKYEYGNGINITISSDNTYYFAISIQKGQTVSDLVFRPMIVSGTEDKPYEPYTGGQPSPSPDYPQEIESVDGYNIIDKIIEKSRAWGNGAIGDYPTMSRTDYIEVKPNTTYYASHSMNGGVGYSIWFYDKDKQAISPFSFEGKGTDSDAFDKSGIFTTPSNAKYLIINYLTATIKTTPPVLVEGTDSNPYLPYGYIGLKQSGKNKFNTKNAEKGTADTIEIIDNNAFNIATTSEKRWAYSIFKISDLKANTEYYLKAMVTNTNSTITNNYTVIKNNNKETITEKYGIAEGFTFNTGENTAIYIYFYVTVANPVLNTSKYEQVLLQENPIEKGIEATSYEPYHEPITTPINLQGNILSKVGDVKDILRINRNGEVEIKKNVGKVVLDGSESWIFLNAIVNSYKLPGFVNGNGVDDSVDYPVFSNYFKSIAQHEVYRGKEGTIQALGGNVNGLYLCFGENSNISNIQKLKTWLSTYNTEVYYKLATPQIITLPSITPIELWQGTNIFKLITNLDTDSEVEYIVDKDSVLNEVQTAMLEAEI